MEKNFCENIINTVMDAPAKTKDDVKVRLEMAEMCDQSELNLKHGVDERTLNPRLYIPFLWTNERGCVSGHND